jgi:fatty acid amide hydrolase 2
MRHLLTLSATELAARIRTGRLTAREVLEVHVARLEQTNPRLNAVVATRLDEARAEADAADARVAEGDTDLPPLHGVPCTIKEAFALTGMPNTSGLVARRDVRATEDAPTVARIRAAGAIPLGVTNVSELCMWMESDNRVYGRTGCAYDPDRIAGGSSGGEGSAIGSGMSPFGLGADIGGSIRMPAFFNGIFGHKPSVGLVPNEGQYPVAENAALRLLATGPLCRRAEDLWPLLEILAGDEHTRRLGGRAPGRVDLSGLTVLDVEDDGVMAVSRDLKAAQRRTADHLERLGARVRRERIRGFRRGLEMWSAVMHTAAQTKFRVLLGNGRPVRPAIEILRCALGRSPYTFPAVGLAFLEGLMELAPVATDRALAYRDQLRGEVLDKLGDEGVLLYPPHPQPAPRHGDPLLPPIRWVYTALFNALELPVTQVPLGLNRRGLPLGVQVAAPPDRDDLSIAVGLELERAFGGWVLPRFGSVHPLNPTARPAGEASA